MGAWPDLETRGSTVGTEIRAGIVTFLTMSYILFVNPQILAQSGMPAADVAVATAVSSAAATLLMALLANYPFALAPGMGLNAYFTFGVVAGMGVHWRVALTAVFIEGVLFLALSLVGIRTALLRVIPSSIKIATMTGIGLFLAVIGMQNAGLVVDDPVNLVALGDLGEPSTLLAIAGILLTAALAAARRRGAILIGIVTVTLGGWTLGTATPPDQFLTMPSLPRETFMALDFSTLFTGKLLIVVLAFLFVDLFDSAGTLIGVGRLGGFVDREGELPRANQAFAADAVGTALGALLGTSTVTTYVESATGIEEGGRTGLAAVVVSVLFLCSLFLTPVFVAIPPFATAPALLIVGALMMEGAGQLDWKAPEEALPAFVTIVSMPLTYSIANGICFGIVTWVALRLLRGRFREVHPALYVLTALLVAFFAARWA
jgi:AGZA family xanthine/uracil permease-like MFS transporter